MKIGTTNPVFFHGLFGAVAGYFFLHPISMVIYWLFDDSDKNSAIGVIEHSFSSSHLHMAMFFVLLGAIIGIAQGLYMSRLTELYKKVESLSLTDELTSLSNRRHLFQLLDREIARIKRHNGFLTLALIDIDYFKNYNDRNGHQAGDEILRAFAKILSSCVREIDIAARYGGEEFVVGLPGINGDGAFGVIERIRQKVESTAFPNMNFQPGGRITISAGIAELPIDGETSSELIRAADAALYRAKGSGRNTTRSSLPPPAASR